MSEIIIGKNVKAKIEKNILTIKVDLSQDFGDTKSGKSISIGTTGAPATIDNNGEQISVGLNVYKPKS